MTSLLGIVLGRPDVIRDARTRFVDIEDLPDEELEALAEEFRELHTRFSTERESRSKRAGEPKDAEK